MASPGPTTQLAGLMRKSGCDGAALPSFSPSARKLFHNAMILVGMHGATSLMLFLGSFIPVGEDSPNRSPSYSSSQSPSRMPNPDRPSGSLKRAHDVMIAFPSELAPDRTGGGERLAALIETASVSGKPWPEWCSV